MELAQLALVARHRGELEHARSLAREALELEQRAASLVPFEQASEPTRSILYRSAASLAYQAGELKVAQRLVAQGLAGFPPAEVEAELNDLYQQFHFELSLQAQGSTLEGEGLRLSLYGNDVGYGTVLYSEFVNRLRSTRNLIDRTVQRLLGAEFRRAGRAPASLQPFTTLVAAPTAGSFSITIKLAVEIGGQLPLMLSASTVIEEILDGIELLNRESYSLLREKIPQQAYYRNFVVLARDIAPDGKKISSVGLSSLKRSVGLTRARSSIELPPESGREIQMDTPVEITGILDYASARRRKESVGLTTPTGQEYDIVLDEGLEDLVRSYFGQLVLVRGHLIDKSKKTTVYPQDIIAVQ